MTEDQRPDDLVDEPGDVLVPEREEPVVAPRPAKDRTTTRRHRLYHGETTFDFIGRQKIWFAVSAAVILLGLVGGIARGGLNLGIDFRGGSSWKVPTTESVDTAKDLMAELGHPESKVQQFTPTVGDTTPYLQVSTKLEGTAKETEAEGLAIRDRLSKDVAAGKPVDFSSVGPSWGGEITKKARNALVIFFLVISLYLSVRFEWRMAAGAIGAVVHDILVTIGVYALVGFEVTPASVVAFLTILGYSLYDTVVVFDRIDENARALAASGRSTYADIVNLSMNQVLMRSLNTSLVAILPILSVLLIGSFALGATSLRDFGLALFIGLVTGAYSSIFVATPILTALKEREPRWAQIRSRLQQRSGETDGPVSPTGAIRPGARRPAIAGDPPTTETSRPNSTVVQPRPRKKSKRR